MSLTPGKLLSVEAVGPTIAGWHMIEAFAAGCPKEHQFRHIRKIRLKPDGPNAPMMMHFAVGLLFHHMRAQWLNDGYEGKLWKDALEKFYTEYPKLKGAERLPDGCYDIALRTFRSYRAYWKTQMKPRVLAVEYELEPRALTPDAPAWAWRGARLDSIEKWPDGVWIGEAKTSYGGESTVKDFYALHGQPLLAMALWSEKETKKWGPLRGVMLDPMKKADTKQEGKAYPRIKLPLRKYGHALEWFKRSFTDWVMMATSIKYNDDPTRIMHCNRPYGPCDYRELCLFGRDGSLGYEVDGVPLHAVKPSLGKEVPPWR